MSIDISFFVPMVYNPPETLYEHIGNFVENSLYFGGKRTYVSPQKRETRLEDEEMWKIALKAAACVFTLGVFPLVMVAAKAIHRFSISEWKPPEIMKTDLEKVREIAHSFFKKDYLSADTRLKIKAGKTKYLVSLNPENTVKIQQVVRTLGRGGFGKVFEVLDVDSKKSQALKIAKPAQNFPGAIKFAEKGLKIEYNNLVELNVSDKAIIGIQAPPESRILKIKKWNPGQRTIVDKYIGFEQKLYDGSLDNLNVPRLPLNQRLKIIHQIALGAKHYRSKGFVHNDLKPANILYIKNGKEIIADIGDFGAAWKAENPEMACASFTGAYVTQCDLTNVSTSTTSYGRLWSGKKLDIFSLGKTFRQLLANDYQNIDYVLGEKKYQKFLGVLKRMQTDCDGFYSSHIFGALGIKKGRPEIEEVIEAVAECL